MSAKDKKPPVFASEAEERAWWEAHDSTDHMDWRKAERVRMPTLAEKADMAPEKAGRD